MNLDVHRSIDHVRVSDFKSLGTTEIEPTGLSLLCGMNSSGKSSVLQAMVFMYQSLREQRLAASGELIDLGMGDQLVRDGARALRVGLRGTATPCNSSAYLHFEAALRGRTDGLGLEVSEITGVVRPLDEVQISRFPENEQPWLNKVLRHTDLVDITLRRTSKRQNANLNRRYLEAGAPQRPLDNPAGTESEWFRLSCRTRSDSQPLAGNKVFVRLSGMTLKSVAVLPCTSGLAQQIEAILEAPGTILYRALQDAASRLRFELAVPQLGTNPDAALGTRDPMEAAAIREARRLETNLDRALTEMRKRGHQKNWRHSSIRAKVAAAIVDPISEDFYFAEIPFTAGLVWRRTLGHQQDRKTGPVFTILNLAGKLAQLTDWINGTEQLQSIFCSRFNYLGPLRDEPRSAYGRGSATDQAIPVGRRGDAFARIYSETAGNVGTFALPTGLPEKPSPPSKQRIDTTIGAWASYIGVGEDVESLRSKAVARAGHQVLMTVDGKQRELPDVGVGASQVLPVLLLLLLARPSGIVLLEQPELHLHPSAQSRLTDFFLFCRPDLRVISETHSEHMVNRLRRRVAEGLVDSGNVALYFVETGDAGQVLTRLNLDSGGGLSHWPRGFMDESALDLRAILIAKKRHDTHGFR